MKIKVLNEEKLTIGPSKNHDGKPIRGLFKLDPLPDIEELDVYAGSGPFSFYPKSNSGIYFGSRGNGNNLVIIIYLDQFDQDNLWELNFGINEFQKASNVFTDICDRMRRDSSTQNLFNLIKKYRAINFR